jgi:hypothetical protein
VKVTPSNQSLILAGEPPFDQTARLVASGTALKRVTILAGRPDAAVVVQADYFSRDDAPSFHFQPPALQYSPRDAVAVAGTNAEATRRAASNSFYRNPLQLYARTQRGLEDAPKPALLDVFA